MNYVYNEVVRFRTIHHPEYFPRSMSLNSERNFYIRYRFSRGSGLDYIKGLCLVSKQLADQQRSMNPAERLHVLHWANDL